MSAGITRLPYVFAVLALISVIGGTLSYAQSWRLRESDAADGWKLWGRNGFEFAALMTGLAFIWLAFFFVTKQYQVDYVFNNSSADLSFAYRLGSTWAGQEGTFLLWALWTGIVGVLLTRKAGKAETSVMPFYGLAQIFVLTMVVLINPFRTSPGVRTDGMGLNPLLQDPWMVIHPPTLFLGYTLMTVPFAFAMGALLRKDYKDWVRAAAPWAIMATTLLITALSMGGHWAYRTLGWGGFWGWDPVENAALLPMLCGLALIHGLFLQRGPNAAGQRLNIGLAISGYVAMLYAGYLTRSGILAQFSNHSFSELPQSKWLLGGLLFFVVLGVGFFLRRYREIPATRAYESVASREFGFYLSVVIIVISAVLVCVGTSTPIFTGWLGHAKTVQPEFYNWTLTPVGALIGLLLAIYPLSTRDGSGTDKLLRRLRLPFALALVGAALMVALSWPKAHTVAQVSAGAMTTSVQWAHLAAATGMVFAGVLALSLNIGVVFKMARSGGLTSAGGFLAHAGFGILLLGIVASAIYSRTQRVKVDYNGQAQAFGYRYRLLNRGRQVTPLRTEVQVWATPTGTPAVSGQAASNWLQSALGRAGFILRPSLARDKSGNQMTSPGIYSHPFYDLYMAPVEFDPGSFDSMPITLKPGQIWKMGPLTLAFGDVSEIGQRGAIDFGIRANLLALRNGQHVEVAPELNLQGKTGTIVSLPGGSRINIDPDTKLNGALTFDFIGPNSILHDPWAWMDVTIKPYIWLVWLGMITMAIGGLLAVIRRTRDNRRRAAELVDDGEGTTISALTAEPGMAEG